MIAKIPTLVVEIPLDVISNAIKNDRMIEKKLQELNSPCEIAHVLSKKYYKSNLPLETEQEWIKETLNASKDNEAELNELLSTKLEGFEELVGETLSDEQKRIIEKNRT